MAGWLNAVADVVWPARCVGCGTAGAWWCGNCAARVRTIGGPVPGAWTGLDGIRAGAYFAEPFSGAIKALKYRHARAVGGELVKYLRAPLERLDATGAELVPIPLHPSRLRERGHNQSAVLAELLSQTTGVPFRASLRRTRPTLTQTGLGRANRFKNLAGAFAWTGPPPDARTVRTATVILIDDVITTGATFAAAAAACRAAGVRHVWGLAAAYRPLGVNRRVSSSSSAPATGSPSAAGRSR